MKEIQYEKLRNLVAKTFSQSSQQFVDKALEYAEVKLAGIERFDGADMIVHGVNVAIIVIEDIGLGRNSTVAAILHDVARIYHNTLSSDDFALLTLDIKDLFGEEVLGIIMGLNDISHIKMKVASEQASDFRDMIVSYSQDPRVVLIKLADRLEVMRSLEMFPKEKWEK